MTLKYTKYQKVNKAYSIYIWFVAIAFIIWIALTAVVTETVESKTLADESFNTGALMDVPVYQSFIPRYNRINSISIDIGKNAEKPDSGKIVIGLCNTDLSVIASETIAIEKMKDYALTEIPVNWEVSPGAPYFLKIECIDNEGFAPVVHYRDKNKNNPAENLELYYGTTLIENGTLNICYQYRVPMGKVAKIYTLIGLLLLGLFTAVLIDALLLKID